MASVWSVPAYLPYVHPPLTPDAIAAAERALGVSLPRSFLDLLREQNGGYLRCTLPNSVHSLLWGIGERYPNIVDQRHWLDLDEAEQPPGAELLVAFDGDGHWYLCLDYRHVGPHGEPSVSFIDVEIGRESAVAPDFASFCAMWVEEFVNPTWGLINITIDQAATALERALGVRFGQASDFDHGYPLRRAQLSPGKISSLWLCPNRVPRGFKRRRDRCAPGVVALFGGEALQLPTHADVTTILACSSEIAKHVESSCHQANLQTVRISRGREF